jgi:hypothetical protein
MVAYAAWLLLAGVLCPACVNPNTRESPGDAGTAGARPPSTSTPGPGPGAPGSAPGSVSTPAADSSDGPSSNSFASCGVGSTRCALGGAIVETCNANGIWMATSACPSGCERGACAGRCTANDRQCGANQTPETCGPDERWVAEIAPCPNVCTGKGECTGDCKPGERKCGDAPNSLTPFLCDEKGKWIAQMPCLNVCSSGSCGGSCTPGSARCSSSDNAAETCSVMGTWEPGPPCKQQTCVVDKCTGSCGPKDTKCGPGNNPQTCDKDGNWKDGPPCKGQTCVQGTCAGDCEPGAARRCSPDGKFVQECGAGGAWANRDSCGGNGCRGATCNVCRPGSKLCQGRTLRTCAADGSGYSDQTCGLSCDASALRCINCVPSAEVCDGRDNDCDGTVDNDIPSRPCDPACAGTIRCVGGHPTSCGSTSTDSCCGSSGANCTSVGSKCVDGSCQKPCQDECPSFGVTCVGNVARDCIHGRNGCLVRGSDSDCSAFPFPLVCQENKGCQPP